MEKELRFSSIELMKNLFGSCDENIRIIEDAFDIRILTGEGNFIVSGNDEGVEKACQVLDKLMATASRNEVITRQNVNYLVNLASEDKILQAGDFQIDSICLTARGGQIKSKTYGQKRYVDAMKENAVVFAIGPAGTGKTYLAVAMAVTAFRNREVERIILTRPAVEAGEKLGFLPGDLYDKVDPYLRPLYDALFEIMGVDVYQKQLEKGAIEIAPLAYMRGRTLDDSFIILDEAQNTTPEQMKMFLTRIGFGSKAVVTGDITQVDLPAEKKSGLREVTGILKDIKGIEFIYLNEKDVVRHELVQKIIKAYEHYEGRGKR